MDVYIYTTTHTYTHTHIFKHKRYIATSRIKQDYNSINEL